MLSPVLNLANPPDTTTRRNSVYLEIMGSSSAFSINYSRAFPVARQFQIHARGGLGVDYGWPSLVTEVTGALGRRHSFEFGTGMTFSPSSRPMFRVAGYRFEQKKFVARLGALIYYEKVEYDGRSFWPYAGLSLGKRF